VLNVVCPVYVERVKCDVSSLRWMCWMWCVQFTLNVLNVICPVYVECVKCDVSSLRWTC